MILLVFIDPEVVINPNDRAVVDVLEACFADSRALISVCVHVCIFVVTSTELACVDIWLFIVL